MPDVLVLGSQGEEVRRLQRNLNAALAKTTVIVDGKNVLPLETKTGIFGAKTKAAVEKFQTDYKLKLVDGKVGDETRRALAMRVLIIRGTVTRDPSPTLTLRQTPPPNLFPKLTLPQLKPPVPTPPVSEPKPNRPGWLFQLQPATGITPAPFFSTNGGGGGSITTGQLAMGIVYRTKSEGPHWEYGGVFQPSVNSQNSPTDPRYTLQLQGNVAYADPYSVGRFHTALFGQVALLGNLAPTGLAVAGQLGGQISIDIIEDKWNLFSQAGVQLSGQWTLFDHKGLGAGQLNFGPVFTILGTTIQWDIK
jgi:peptidoglycan hydrolase-like protein with peptidoglycan-binding domain